MLWTRLILAIAKSWNLKPESGTWKQEKSIGFLSNLKMCFCLLVELDVFVLFCTSSGNGNVFHQKLAFSWRGTKKTKKTKTLKSFLFFLVFLVPPQEMATFSTKSLHFPGGVPKKPKKPKILDSSGLAFAKTLKSLFFFVFLVPPQEMATFSTKSLHFPGGVPKKPKKSKILDSSSLAFAKTLKSLVFFVFLVPPQEMATFSTKSLHFPGGVPKKPKKPKILDCSGLGFFGFFGTSSGNGNVFHQKLAFSWRGTKKTKKTKDFGRFSTKSLHFPGGVPKKPKKPKILDSSGLAFAKTLKSLVFLVPPQEMATFSTKSLHFPGGVPKKPK